MIYNHGHNILRLFDNLPNLCFTTSETNRDYFSVGGFRHHDTYSYEIGRSFANPLTFHSLDPSIESSRKKEVFLFLCFNLTLSCESSSVSRMDKMESNIANVTKTNNLLHERITA